MDSASLITELCQSMKLPLPKDVAADQFQFSFKEDIELFLKVSPDGSHLTAFSYLLPSLGSLNPELSLRLMKLNAFGSLAGSAMIGFSDEHESFVLSERFDLQGLSSGLLLEHLKGHLRVIRTVKEEMPKWQLEMVQGKKASGPKSSPGQIYLRM